MVPALRPLARVKVPFGKRRVVGFVIAVDVTGAEEDALKEVEKLVDPIPLMNEAGYELCDWASRYYVAPIGLALKYALSSAISIEKYCEARFENGPPFPLGQPLKKVYALLGRPLVYEGLGQGTIQLCDVFTERTIEAAQPEDGGPGFSAEMRICGVHGRLEYYSTLISEQLQQGRNCLMLLPDRFGVGEFYYRELNKRFPGKVLWYSSSMGGKKRAEAYFRSRSQSGQLVLGNKSAVFLPLRSPGLLIVERPEEDQYRNEDCFKFNTVQLALKKAQIEAVPLVFGSVSPPIEIMRLVEDGEVRLTAKGDFPSPEAKGDFPSPEVSFIVSGRDKGQRPGLPSGAVDMIGAVLQRNGNVVVHTTRRAYAAGLNCSVCGQAVSCPHCGSFSVSYRKDENRLICGTCKGSPVYTESCPFCGSSFIRFFDIGAEYLESWLKDAFPDAPVIRLTGEKERKTKGLPGRVGSRRQGLIVVGTNVLSKLYGFDADLLILFGWDRYLGSGGGGFRAQEKMFQVYRNLLDAVRPPRLLVCTNEREPVQLSGFLDFTAFYSDELSKRRMAEFPPYERFFLVNILKRSEAAGDRIVRRIEKLIALENLEPRMLGPIEVKGQYAWRIVLKGDEKTLSPLLSSLYGLAGVHIEADPLYI